MINNREISLWLISLIMGISFFSFSQQSHPFIENKGQYPKFVNAKAKIPSGSIFIEKGRFIYGFYSSSQLLERHNLVREEKDRRSLNISKLLKSNEDLETSLIGSSNL